MIGAGGSGNEVPRLYALSAANASKLPNTPPLQPSAAENTQLTNPSNRLKMLENLSSNNEGRDKSTNSIL